MAVSFDLFGTLVAVEPQGDAAAAIATELARRGVDVPDGWSDAYGTPYADVPPERERSLVAHVRDALDACGASVASHADDADDAHADEAADNDVAGAVRAALYPDPSDITARDGAPEAVDAATARGPVGVLSNCSAPGLAGHCLGASDIDRDAFDAVVTSVGCGWRKPAPEAFETVAAGMSVEPGDLVHVGDRPAADGGVTGVGGEFLSVEDVPLTEFPAWLEGREC